MNTEDLKIPTSLDVTVYGNLEPVNATLSKSRVRIFYKGMNRNRTFISEDFANQLISSLPYTPVKGIFNKDTVDYEDHGENNTDGRIYGIVPSDPNFAWEKHLDVDGVEREYACADVYLFTGLYPEAKLIPGESQSMEIFRNTLQGEWKISEEDKQPYYHFISGSLVGLQVLGQDVEPCFEGAAFYSLNKDIQYLVEYVKKISEKEEKVSMDKTLFRISDNEKAEILFDLINPNFNEEGNWKIDAMIMDVYDDYALCVSRSGGYQRVYYTRDGDNITIGETVAVKIVDVTESEYNALEAMKIASGSFEEYTLKFEELNKEVEELREEKANFENQAVEETSETTETVENEVFENSEETSENIEENFVEPANEETLTETSNEETEQVDYSAQIEALEAEKLEMQKQLSDIKNENESLMTFKKEIEKSQKEAILLKYEEYLSETTIAELKNNIDNYSVDDFKKEVCTAAVESDSAIFSNRKNEPEIFYKGGELNSGEDKNDTPAIRLLNKYKNGGNK